MRDFVFANLPALLYFLSLQIAIINIFGLRIGVGQNKQKMSGLVKCACFTIFWIFYRQNIGGQGLYSPQLQRVPDLYFKQAYIRERALFRIPSVW